ncbi:hypothetical protein M2243_002459 [Heliophilum fasciatum]|nr:copper amine oxidase N-terminal domain-containing protein [Heliophilum fasciatum]MCW2279008.1 hypothetical protein [Heliophilum fasciatum]
MRKEVTPPMTWRTVTKAGATVLAIACVAVGSLVTPATAQADVYTVGTGIAACNFAAGGVQVEFPDRTYDKPLRLELRTPEASRLKPLDTFYVVRATDVSLTTRGTTPVTSLAQPMRIAYTFNTIDHKRASRMNTDLPITRFRVGYWNEAQGTWQQLPSKIFWNGNEGIVEAESTLGTGLYSLIWTYEAEPLLSNLADDEIRLMVNYQQVKSAVAPYLKDGRTMVPLRIIGQELGAQVSWDTKESRIELVKGKDTLKLWVGQPKVLKNDEPLATNALSDTVVPEITQGSTFVPLRLVADALGATVNWEGKTRTVYIGTKQ